VHGIRVGGHFDGRDALSGDRAASRVFWNKVCGKEPSRNNNDDDDDDDDTDDNENYRRCACRRRHWESWSSVCQMSGKKRRALHFGDLGHFRGELLFPAIAGVFFFSSGKRYFSFIFWQ
jgi:hypothetical protein